MTRASYSFLDGAPLAGERNRILPTENEAAWDAHVAADATFPLTAEEQEADALAARILDDLAAPAERERGRHVVTHFPALYEMLREYSAEYPSLSFQAPPTSPEVMTVSVCCYALLFCFGAVAYAADCAGRSLSVRYEIREESICLSLSHGGGQGTDEEGCTALVSAHRLDVMKKLAEVSGFSIALTDGPAPTVEFHLLRRVSDVITTAAASSFWLRRAFFLPRYYFY